MKKVLLVTLMIWTGGATAGWIVGVDSLNGHSSKITTNLTLKSKSATVSSGDIAGDTISREGLAYHVGYRYDLVQIRLARRAYGGETTSNDYSFTSFAVGMYRQYEMAGIQWQWDLSLGLASIQYVDSEYRSADLQFEVTPELGRLAEGNLAVKVLPNTFLTLGYFIAFLEDDVSGDGATSSGVDYILTGSLKEEIRGLHFGFNYQF